MSMINGAQIRGARGLLGWSASLLAQRAHVGTATVQRIESAQYEIYGQSRSLDRIQHALAEAGVQFIEGAEGEIGVQLKLPFPVPASPGQSETFAPTDLDA